MRKDDICSLMRTYVRKTLSPTPAERDFVSGVYAEVSRVLGGKCIMIGSFARFTAVTPLHDLDVLYILGHWSRSADPTNELRALEQTLKTGFKNPTGFSFKVTRQTHSVTVSFIRNSAEVFAVDIVPSYILGSNEFGDDTYMVPEIVTRGHATRALRYQELARRSEMMTWIKSDPRGYNEVAKRANDRNDDFRKSVKFVKGWKCAVKRRHPDLTLKSFHLEQIVTLGFSSHPDRSIFDAVFNVFCDLPKYLERAQIPDRADAARLIDSYVDELSVAEKRTVLEVRDRFLIDLERLDELDRMDDLFGGERHRRGDPSEAYLFDSRIPVLLDEEEQLTIQGLALVRDGFRATVLDKNGLINVDRKIRFSVVRTTGADSFKWKVKNDDECSQPRGEITHGKTRNDPENTQYNGDHFVECYAIKNGVCVARARQNVRIRRFA